MRWLMVPVPRSLMAAVLRSLMAVVDIDVADVELLLAVDVFDSVCSVGVRVDRDRIAAGVCSSTRVW
jgi:hypothetical protein